MFVSPKACAICREPFTPVKRSGGWSRTCGKGRCRALLGVQTEAWRSGLAKARAARVAQRETRLRARAEAQFGPMSERELASWAWAEREGYDRGYNAFLAARRRRAA